MAVFLLQEKHMKKKLLFGALTVAAAAFLVSCASFGDSLKYINQDIKLNHINRIIYFNPEVIPDVFEIKDPTYNTFFSAASDKMMSLGTRNYLKIDTPMSFDEVDIEMLKDLCRNNEADIAIVPKVTYFKVGFGKYVFSNQVVVSLKLYDSKGNFIMETSYDTYKGNGRMLGSAENSVKIGTKGALNKMNKELQNRKMLINKSS